jgi:hypothetical protein
MLRHLLLAFDLPELLNGLKALGASRSRSARRGGAIFVLSGTTRGCAVVEFSEGPSKPTRQDGDGLPGRGAVGVTKRPASSALRWCRVCYWLPNICFWRPYSLEVMQCLLHVRSP